VVPGDALIGKLFSWELVTVALGCDREKVLEVVNGHPTR
jgi:hypothetical protein